MTELSWTEIKTEEAEAPSPRTYFSAVTHANRLYLFGGFGDSKGRFNDLRSYDTKSRKWELCVGTGDVPRPVYLHSAVVYRNQLWVFGGSVGNDTNDLFSYNFETRIWTRHETSGAVPSARYGHAAVVCGGAMIVAGGCKQSSIYFRDSYLFEFATKNWRRLADVPLDLAYHILVCVDAKVYLVGGYNGVRFAQHVYVLDPSSASPSWEPLEVRGKEPSPRCGAGVVVVDKMLYCFAGFSQSGHNAELYRLDLTTHNWEILECKNKPLSRAYLQAAYVNNQLFVFGGYDGGKCVADFRSLEISTAEPPNIARILAGGSAAQCAEFALRHFSRNGKSMDCKELESAFANLALNLGHLQSQYPFDTTHLQELISAGFSRDEVIDVMKEMHSRGQETKNVSLVVESLLQARDKPRKPIDPPAALSRQKSEKTELKATVDSLTEERNELRNCRVCLDNTMNTVLLPCAHLAICHECAQEMMRKQFSECPICRKKVLSNMLIYWS